MKLGAFGHSLADITPWLVTRSSQVKLSGVLVKLGAFRHIVAY